MEMCGLGRYPMREGTGEKERENEKEGVAMSPGGSVGMTVLGSVVSCSLASFTCCRGLSGRWKLGSSAAPA